MDQISNIFQLPIISCTINNFLELSIFSSFANFYDYCFFFTCDGNVSQVKNNNRKINLDKLYKSVVDVKYFTVAYMLYLHYI